MVNPNYMFEHWDEDGDPYEQEIRTVECRYCGKGGLCWHQTAAGWELRDHRGVHLCKQMLQQKGFPVEDAD
jgi:hypothetical protein